MGKQLFIEEIEEFEPVNRIPRIAITNEMLAEVSQLNEITEIEVFLREILADRTETPHTATEIGDVLTTITYQGTPLLAGFVNKGKSTHSVTERHVGHQISRVRRMPGIEVIVLLAVGNIQDDIKANLIQTAIDAQLNYMIIDTTDVARLFIAHHKLCPRDGSPYREQTCSKCGETASEPLVLSLRVYEEPRYNLLSQSDNSFAEKKRYSAEVWVDPHYPKSVIREVIKKVTWELRHSNYYRSSQVEERFGNREADEIWLFIYFDEQDRHTRNWYCRSRWVSRRLFDSQHPIFFPKSELLGEIEIDWKKDYYMLRTLFTTSTGTKQSWANRVEYLLPLLKELVENAKRSLEALHDGRIDEVMLGADFAMWETMAGDTFMQATEKELPPIECRDCNQKFLNMISQCHNIFLPFATWGQHKERDWTEKLWLINDALRRYEVEKTDFEYEWRKLRG